MKKLFISSIAFGLLLSFNMLFAFNDNSNPQKRIVNNSNYWQQHVDYSMEIDMNVKTYQYKGKQSLVYTNNSPDVLTKVYYHLYFNAFQPGSEMDMRSRSIADPDGRVGDRISKLQPDEIGYINVSSLNKTGKLLAMKLLVLF
jgi:hypothetical protein